MAPTESVLLTTLLLHPAPLHTALPEESFATCFPKRWRAHPQVAYLYRTLQHHRAFTLDRVRANIEDETKRGEGMRRDVVRQARRDAERKGEGAVEREREELDLDGSQEGRSESRLVSSN